MKIMQIFEKYTSESIKWSTALELSREEATVISTVLGRDICSREIKYASLSLNFLLQNLISGLLANSMRESSGCIVILEFDNTIVSMITGKSEVSRDDIEELIIRVFSIINALYPQIQIVKPKKSLCFNSDDVNYINKLLEKATLLCMTWYTGDFKGLEFTIASENIEPIAKIQVESSIPPILAGRWIHMWKPRLTECLEIEKNTIIIEGKALKPTSTVECINLDIKLKDIDRQVIDKTKITFNDLKNNQSYAMLIETLNHPHIIDTTDVELRKTQNTIIATITPRTNPGERIKITIYTKVNQ